MPAFPALDETGWNATAVSELSFQCRSAIVSRAMISAGAEGTAKMPASLLNASVLNGVPARISNFGNQVCASACPGNSPDKSTMCARLFLARSKFLLLNAGEPVQNTIQALLKLS